MKFLYLVLVIFSYIKSLETEDENGHNSNIILLLCNDIGGGLYITINFGTPSIIRYLLFDLENDINILVTDIMDTSPSNKHYSSSLNIINPNEYINIYNTQTSSIRLEDTIQLEGNHYEMRLPFNYINGSKLIFYDQISLCSSFKNESNSLVHTLYNNKLITFKKFGIFHNNINDALLCLGGFPKQITKSLLYKHKLKIANKKSSKWTININGFIIGDINNSNIYTTQEIGLITTRERFIYAPMYFFEFLNKTKQMQMMLEQKICFTQVNKNIYELLCKCGFLNRLENVTFIIDGHMLQMHPYKLFKSYYDKCLFQIKGYYDNMDNNWESKWVLGIMLLKEYPMLFNIEDKTITIYSQNENFKKLKLFDLYYETKYVNLQLRKVGYVVIICLQGLICIMILFSAKKADYNL